MARLKQPARDLLRAQDRLHRRAVEVARDAFPKHLKSARPFVTPYALARARNGDDSNPVGRLFDWLLALKGAGRPKSDGLRIAEAVRRAVDELWSTADLPAWTDLALREQESDAAEDILQVAALAGDMDAKREWVAALDRHIADSVVLRDALAKEVGV